MDYNVKESFITEEKLNTYYLIHFYTGERNAKKYRKETLFRYLYNVLILIGFLAIIEEVLLLCKQIFSSLYEYPLVLVLCMVGMTLFVIMCYKGIKLLNHRLFPLNAKSLKEAHCKIDIGKYHDFLRLQKILLENNVVRVGTNDETCELTVTYQCGNGCEKSEAFFLPDGTYMHIVKEDCFDFRWVDESINRVLKDYGFAPIVEEELFIPNRIE